MFVNTLALFIWLSLFFMMVNGLYDEKLNGILPTIIQFDVKIIVKTLLRYVQVHVLSNLMKYIMKNNDRNKVLQTMCDSCTVSVGFVMSCCVVGRPSDVH